MENKTEKENVKDFAKYVLENLGTITVGELIEMRGDHVAKLGNVLKKAKQLVEG